MKAPRRYCAYRGYPPCQNRVLRGYCPEHTHHRTRQRTPTHPEYDSKRWQDYRKQYVADHPQCARCKAVTYCPDHIVPSWVEPDWFYLESNHQPLCRKCNTAKGYEDAITYRGQAQPMKRHQKVPIIA
jgi:5-methylcytosine-specific restriction endonuclease McrA